MWYCSRIGSILLGARGAPVVVAMAATSGVRAGPVPAVSLLRRRAIEKLTEAIHELWFCGVAPEIADRLEHEVVPKLDAGGVPRLAQAYDLVRWSRDSSP